MIRLTPAATIAVVSLAALLVVGWGASVSVRSATRGPAWALQHLRHSSAVVTAGLVLGVVVLAAVRPVWVGLTVFYMAAMAWWLTTSLRRNLERVEASGFDEVPTERRRELVARARRWMVGGAAVIGAVAVFDLAGGGTAAWPFTLALAAVLALSAALLRPSRL